MVGIPSSVVDLWKSLGKVEVFPILAEHGDEKTMDQVKSLGEVYGRFTGKEGEPKKFRERIAKISAYRQISQRWPEDDIKALFEDQAPTGLDDDTVRILVEAEHLHSLSLAVEAAVPKAEVETVSESRPAAVIVGPGFHDARVDFVRPATPASETTPIHEGGNVPKHATEEIVAESLRILKERWKAVASQLSGEDDGKLGQVDLCCLMMSLYSERSANLSQDVTPPVALEWIRKAREARRSTASSANLFLFASLVALGFAAAVMFLLASLPLGKFAISIPAGASALQPVLSMVMRLTVMLLPTVPVVYMVRATLDRELHWRPWTEFLVPRTLQYLGIAVLALVIGAFANLLYIFVDPYISGSENKIIQFSEILELPRITEAAMTALSGTVLAVILSLTYDQEERETNRSFNVSITILGVLLALFLAFALLFDPLYQEISLLRMDERVLRWMMTICVGFIVFAIVVASIRKRRSKTSKQKDFL